MFRTVSVMAGLIGCLVPLAAHAAEEDANIWLAQTATVDLGGGGQLWLEAQERFTNDASRLGQFLVRPAIGYKLDKTTTAWIGYAYVMTDPVGPVRTNEHRLFQQLSFRLLGDGKGVTITGRTRLEQRFLEEQPGTAWRLRQQLRLTAPLSGKMRGVVWTEPFIGLNETGFQRDGLGLWRNFAGVSVPLGKAVTLEPGYLNQWVVRNGADRVDHTANLTLSASF
ncbi:DUF2490 domain-containing protein [Novosphingobium sp. TH158]|uniref:DUF2490 domain-containing protein n=1 Tax=Novosphingobium sp. TH158 TaxID=2067455 RepID=UPI000C7E013E|nr:DUF2490 domain-containing protein [Novosphingobium sp. TH158]PLK27498.1 DUF2490 domain-containing protein [Novosphingobium sp. TH158]